MSNCKIICEMPNKEIIHIDCELQNVKNELLKKTNQIHYENMILIDISETQYKSSNSETQNNQMKDLIYFKVYDANYLYKEFKEIENIKNEQEKQIIVFQDKNTKLELELNQIINKSNSQKQKIKKLKEENQKQQNNNHELHIQVVSITSEKNAINQVWQTCLNQMSQLMQQNYINAAQTNNTFQINNLENLQIQIKDLQAQLQNSKQETEKYQSLLKGEKEKLEKINNNLFKSENTIKQQIDKIKKYEKELKQLKDRISPQELSVSTAIIHNAKNDDNTTLSSKEQEIIKLNNINKKLTQDIQYLVEENQQLIDSKLNLEAENQNNSLTIMNLTQNIDQLNKETEEIKKKILKKVTNTNNFQGKLNNNQENYEGLLETQQRLYRLVEEMKEKEMSLKIEIQQLTKQAEIEKMKAEKEKEIQEIQEKYNKLELQLNQMTNKCNAQDENIRQLQDDIQTQITNNDKLQKKNEDLNNEITKINQDQNNYQCKQQHIYSELKTLMEQQIQQQQITIYQANNDYAIYIGNLQQQIQDLQDQLQIQKQDTDKQKKLLKQEKDKANESQTQSENTITQLNEKIRKYERDIKQLKDKNNELEMNYRNTHMEVQGATSTLSNKEIENKKLQSQNKQLTLTIQQLEYDNQQLQNHIQNFEAKIVDYAQQIFNLNQNIEQLNDQIEQWKEDIRKKGLESDKYKNESKNLQLQKESIDRECQELKNQLQRLKEEIEIKENGGQVNQNEISRLKNQIIKLEKDINDQNKLNQENQEKIRYFKTQITTKDGEISYLDIKLNKLQNQLKQKDEQISNDQDANEVFKQQMNVIIQGMKSEIEQSNQKLEIKDHILKKLSKQMQDDKYYDKVIGLMDKLMQSPNKIYQIEKDQTAQFDLKDYEIFEINFEFNKAKELLKKNQYFLFEQCLNKNPKGNVKLNRSILPNAKSTFFKGYLSIVKEADQNEFKGKYFLRKDLISQNDPFTNIDEAIEMSKNNFLCQLLMEQFNKILKSQKLKEGDYQIARQFILKSKDKEEYYYCEMVEEGEFKKINGGAFNPKLSETDSYFNAFSKFVYAFSKENYIITHLQICGKKVHDMIVSTTYKGLFSTLDQGSTEIGQFIETINSEPANMINQHWRQIVEDIAKEGFK
ncbi:unnamed protein product [Paramecium pentaurelia]|uniref:Alpha-type protein kinase domain-containing protein n=1 Tax=Paramecium pentaurelia TaxID=43138 RepID=A0A8S1VND4_9CILI|nr:unnamed protein product [Paramecium pentaurelia]